MKMVGVNYVDYAYEAYMTLAYHDIDYIAAFLKKFREKDLPETIREEILPRMEDFLIDNY